MLEKAGPDACKIDVTDTSVGLIGKTYQLSEQQAQAILDMRLQRLTGLEQDKLIKEYEEIIEHITYLLEILGDSDRLIEVVKDELKEVQEKYKDDRRTEIQDSAADLTEADLITPEDRVVTISHEGYAKTQPLGRVQSSKKRRNRKNCCLCKG